MSWRAIRSQERVDVSEEPLAQAFARQMKATGRPLPISMYTKTALSSTDLQEIEKLREAEVFWSRIVKLKFDGRYSDLAPSIQAQHLRRAYRRQTSQLQPRQALSKPSELREITRLRVAKGYSWIEVARLLYPVWRVETIRERFYQKVLEEDADPSLQDPNDHSTALLREEMKSWLQSIMSKYPGLYNRTVCEEVLREAWQRDNEGTRGRGHGLTMSTAEARDIIQLREEGMRWIDIRDLKFPDLSPTAIQHALSRWKRYNGQPSARDKAFTMSEADRRAVTRLRKERKTWPEIAALMFPEWSPDTLRRHYKMERGNASNRVRGTRPPFRASPADRLEVARLRKQGLSWFQIAQTKFPTWSEATMRRHFKDVDPSQKGETDV